MLTERETRPVRPANGQGRRGSYVIHVTSVELAGYAGLQSESNVTERLSLGVTVPWSASTNSTPALPRWTTTARNYAA
ncbi:hypothetical protein GCM10010449_56960 [Streptomyces rectiviolaceus]|uniref:Uncharacterized protein n=1 Tax=Streptomyces rectiviolaceus TaxID=332591 RepID=A0ABP6MY49_9ACTN